MRKLDFPEAAEVTSLLSDWRQGSGSLRQRLAERLRDAIERGDLAVGTRLPPERTLGRLLGLSRTTVMATYALLREEGWVQSRRGNGTFVAAPRSAEGHRDQLVAHLARNPIFSGLIESPAMTVDFAAASPAAAAPVADAARLAAGDLEAHLRRHGYCTPGLPALRQAIAAYLSRSALPTSEDEVLVTTGSQQAISLVVTLYVQPADSVVIEKPTYPGALDALRSAGARLYAIPIGEQGVQANDLRQMLSRTQARLAYLTPSFNNPTGTVVPVETRRELARVAAEFQATLVEDHALAAMSLDRAEPPPPISAFAADGGVILVGSLSKLFWGGLRVGWVRAPRPVIRRLARVKAVADVASSLLPQLVAVRLLPLAEEVRAERRRELGGRLDELTSLLEEHVPTWEWCRPAGGVSLWVRLPEGSAVDFAEVALRHGVAVVPGPHFCPDDGCQDRLRIPFCLDRVRLESGVRRLARAWAAYAPVVGQARAHQHHRAIV
jgi:DNA-binding transcriptional MocR family regulator